MELHPEPVLLSLGGLVGRLRLVIWLRMRLVISLRMMVRLRLVVDYRTRGVLHHGWVSLLVHESSLLLLLDLLLQGGHGGVDLVLEGVAGGGGAWTPGGVQ